MFHRTVYDVKAFYNTPMGHAVRQILQQRIQNFWPELHGLRILGCGYATPYLETMLGTAERVLVMMPAGQGADHWPPEHKSLVFLSEEAGLPLEDSSVDRILLIHNLECCEHLQSSLGEVWRVLKPNGRLLVIVPNRSGFWARADWSPFGQGSPFSLSQLCFYLHNTMFVQERTEGALFVPPIRLRLVIRWANVFEKMGRSFFPIVAGVHIVEASKQIYARADKGSGFRAFARSRGFLGVRPAVVPVPQGFIPNKQSRLEREKR